MQHHITFTLQVFSAGEQCVRNSSGDGLLILHCSTINAIGIYLTLHILASWYNLRIRHAINNIHTLNLHNNVTKLAQKLQRLTADIPLYTQPVGNPSEMDVPQIHSRWEYDGGLGDQQSKHHTGPTPVQYLSSVTRKQLNNINTVLQILCDHSKLGLPGDLKTRPDIEMPNALRGKENLQKYFPSQSTRRSAV